LNDVRENFKDALRIHTAAIPLVEASGNPSLRGRFHVNFALILRNLASAEDRSEYLDRALIEYTAASFHFEQAGPTRYCARVENSLGFLFSTIGRFEDAHKHIDQARHLFSGLEDKGSVAQVDDTRARVLLLEGHSAEAERVSRGAVETLERSGEQSLLAQSLTTHGAALARIARTPESRAALQRAVEVAAQAGDPESAGVASLTTIEELSRHLRASELLVAYEQAAEFLHSSQRPDLPKRFFSCGCKIRSAVDAQLIASNTSGGFIGASATNRWQGFSLDKEVQY
jgi:tetratricopeptide (TPR) repeat protein